MLKRLPISIVLSLLLAGCGLWTIERETYPPVTVETATHRYAIPADSTYIRFKQTHLESIQQLDSLLTMDGRTTSSDRLLQQGTDYIEVGLPAFAVPPETLFTNILPTLRVLEEEIEPLIGEVMVVSGYRTRKYNSAAGGADQSRHLYFDAVDVVPVTRIPERILKRRLRQFWYEKGEEFNLGLGLYGHSRFHIDTWRYRNWGNWPDEG